MPPYQTSASAPQAAFDTVGVDKVLGQYLLSHSIVDKAGFAALINSFFSSLPAAEANFLRGFFIAAAGITP